jgi:hypothetical protein
MTLNLEDNQIGPQGVQHLATALEHNNVIQSSPPFFLSSYSLTIVTDTHYT